MTHRRCPIHDSLPGDPTVSTLPSQGRIPRRGHLPVLHVYTRHILVHVTLVFLKSQVQTYPTDPLPVTDLPEVPSSQNSTPDFNPF